MKLPKILPQTPSPPRQTQITGGPTHPRVKIFWICAWAALASFFLQRYACIASNKLCIQWNFKLVLIFFSFIRFMQYIQKHRNKITVESRLKKITGISTFLNHNSIISLSSIKETKIWQTCYIRNIRLYCPHDKVLKIQTIIPLIWEYSIPG